MKKLAIFIATSTLAVACNSQTTDVSVGLTISDPSLQPHGKALSNYGVAQTSVAGGYGRYNGSAAVDATVGYIGASATAVSPSATSVGTFEQIGAIYTDDISFYGGTGLTGHLSWTSTGSFVPNPGTSYNTAGDDVEVTMWLGSAQVTKTANWGGSACRSGPCSQQWDLSGSLDISLDPGPQFVYFLLFSHTRAGDSMDALHGIQFTLDLPAGVTYSTPHNDFLTAVPEPASLAMMLVGFGVVGAAAQRRKHA